MALASNHSMTQGWVDAPDNGGTIDIIWSCLSTLFLCSWSVLCLNVPAADDGYWRVFARKLRWAGLAIYGPEFIFVHAIGQWYSARVSIHAFRLLNLPEWTLRHAFFADMGGFVLSTPYEAPFPVNAYQIHHLVKERYMAVPDIPLKVIDDKDKANGFVRLIVVLQTVWFVSKCIGRAAQGLAITTFELTMLAFVFCTLGTFFCWRHKPLDMDTPIVLPVDAALAEMHHRTLYGSFNIARSDHDAYIYIPDAEHVDYFSTVLRRLGFQRPSAATTAHRTRMPNDRLPLTFDTPTTTFMLVTVSSYAAIHLAGWNLVFPSPEERILWCVSSCIMFGTTIVFWVVDRAALWFHNNTLSAPPSKDRHSF